MTIFLTNASCSERKSRMELMVKLKKLIERVVIGGSNYASLKSESCCSEMKYRIELTVKLKKLKETLVIGGSYIDSLNSES